VTTMCVVSLVWQAGDKVLVLIDSVLSRYFYCICLYNDWFSSKEVILRCPSFCSTHYLPIRNVVFLKSKSICAICLRFSVRLPCTWHWKISSFCRHSPCQLNQRLCHTRSWVSGSRNTILRPSFRPALLLLPNAAY